VTPLLRNERELDEGGMGETGETDEDGPEIRQPERGA